MLPGSGESDNGENSGTEYKYNPPEKQPALHPGLLFPKLLESLLRLMSER